MPELTTQQQRIITTSFEMLPVRHTGRDDVHQLAFQYLWCRNGVDWNDPKSLRSAARNAILSAAIQQKKRHSRDSWITVNSLELARHDPPAPDVLRINEECWNDDARFIARVHSIPQPNEDDVSRSFSHMLLRVKAVRMLRSIRKDHTAEHYARIRRAACHLAAVTGTAERGLILEPAVRHARLVQLNARKAEKRKQEQKRANRANFRLRRMLRELLAQ